MQPFDQNESAYTATAKNIVLTAGDRYAVSKLDNPVREKINHALTWANIENYKTLRGAV